MNMIAHIAVAVRDRKRLQDIAGVATRFGIDDLLRRLKLTPLLPQGVRAGLEKEAAELSLPERVCRALEELGPTFVKLGQILSARGDVLPPEWIAAFEKLHSRADAIPYEDIKSQIEEDLGAAPEDIFAAFDPAPVAAGSIAQVYRARLKEGGEVAIKVRRPGIVPVIEADLRILASLAALAEHHAPDLRRYRLPDIVRYLNAALRDELDFTREGRNAEQIAANFTDQPHIVIPAIYWDYTGTRLLVQDYIEGFMPTDPQSLADAGLDPVYLAGLGTDAVLRMALVDGIFHGDPHPGNILCLPGNRIAFLDFGMTGRVTPRRRDELMTLIDAIVHEQGARVRDILLQWSAADAPDMRRLDNDADMFVTRHRVPPLDFSRAIGDFMAMARSHDLVLPADLVLLFKALVTAEGVARKLDPQIDVIAHAAPLARGFAAQAFSPDALKELGRALLSEGRSLSAEAPGALRGLMRSLQRGRFAMDIEIKGLEKAAGGLERSLLCLAVAMVTAAFALGLAPHLVRAESEIFGFPVFTALGLAVTVGGILYLALAGRRK